MTAAALKVILSRLAKMKNEQHLQFQVQLFAVFFCGSNLDLIADQHISCPHHSRQDWWSLDQFWESNRS